ncbi:MAG: hypothetical protein K1X28_10455 [Parachlamydiales bacterium]|nr:hypothetical protein [Parachlamydiales bacterium]
MYNTETDKKTENISLFFTHDEALQLKAYLDQFLAKPIDRGLHFHLNSEDYQKQITVCIYDPNKINQLHPRARKLILEDHRREHY